MWSSSHFIGRNNKINIIFAHISNPFTPLITVNTASATCTRMRERRHVNTRLIHGDASLLSRLGYVTPTRDPPGSDCAGAFRPPHRGQRWSRARGVPGSWTSSRCYPDPSPFPPSSHPSLSCFCPSFSPRQLPASSHIFHRSPESALPDVR